MPVVPDYGEIILNDVHYKVRGNIQRVLASIYPPKVVIGDISKDANPRASSISWGDVRGGLGVDRITELDKPDRLRRAECNIRWPGENTLPYQSIATSTTNITGTPRVLSEFSSTILVADSLNIRSYNNGTDAWSAALDTLPAGSTATDSIIITLGGTAYQIFAGTTGYSYTSNGTTWTDDTQDTLLLADWDSRLWGIDAAGNIWYATTIGTETLAGQLQLRTGETINSFFVGPDASGEPILYVCTTHGLYAYDAPGEQFIQTAPFLPMNPETGNGAVAWQGAIYIPAGKDIYEYNPVAATVRRIGFEYLDSTAFSDDGYILKLIPAHRELIALVDDGVIAVLAWNGTGWMTLDRLTPATNTMYWGIISNSYSVYRLWFSYTETTGQGTVRYIRLPTLDTNPTRAALPFAASGVFETPWLRIDAKDTDVVAIDITAECDNMSAARTIQLAYGVDYSTTRTNIGSAITTSGVTTVRLPNNADPFSGTSFRSFCIRATFTGTAGATTSPVLVTLTLTFRKKLRGKWGYAFTLDLREDYGGNTPQQMQDALITAAESVTLVNFSYKESTAGNWATVYVDVIDLRSLEYTGADYRGLVSATVAEP